MDEMPSYDYVQLLVKRNDIDAEDPLENVWRRDYLSIYPEIFYNNDILKGENDVNSFVLRFRNEDSSHMSILVNGFLYGILSSPEHLARDFLKHMGWFQSDKFSMCIDLLTRFIIDKYYKATDTCKRQIFWLIKELIIMDVKRVRKCIIALMKNCIAGNISSDNIILIESLSDLCLQYKFFKN